MAAQSGIAGSASLGNRVLVGGQVGMYVHALHLHVCACIASAYLAWLAGNCSLSAIYGNEKNNGVLSLQILAPLAVTLLPL